MIQIIEKILRFFLLFSASILLFSHCGDSPYSVKLGDVGDVIVKGDMVEGIGTITYIGVEGGFYGIVTNQENYDPINLPSTYAVDGLKVEFKAKIREDLVSIHMWGILIELTYIKKLGKISSGIT